MKNISPMLTLSLLTLVVSTMIFVSFRFELFSSLQPESTSESDENQSTGSFFRQENSRISQSQQYVSQIQQIMRASLGENESLGATIVLYPYALQPIERNNSIVRISVLEWREDGNDWEIITTTDKQIDAQYLSQQGIPINDARQLMRLFRREE